MGEESVMIHAVVVEEEEFDNDILIISDNHDEYDDVWELINPSDADESDTDSLLIIDNGFLSLQPQIQTQQPEIPTPDLTALPHVDVDFGERSRCEYDGGDVEDDDAGVEDDVDDDDDDDGYGLDDELVPWQVSGKLGRERMRKLGKRVFAKMGSSKRNPYLFLKPGCVRGKHGLGIKA